ncbi:hypothetical protein SDC9_162866 [bioreactor metagenome]|uniref:Uncharacterized protein n=1 Tax=bioreactor metagenome TaxID=1076179 RepID=A0A645FPM4_9ZZZZ
MGEQVALSHVGALHPGQGVKVLYLGGHLGLKGAAVKTGDGGDAVPARQHAVPQGGNVVAHGSDRSEAGNHNSVHGSSLSQKSGVTWPVRRQCG